MLQQYSFFKATKLKAFLATRTELGNLLPGFADTCTYTNPSLPKKSGFKDLQAALSRMTRSFETLATTVATAQTAPAALGTGDAAAALLDACVGPAKSHWAFLLPSSTAVKFSTYMHAYYVPLKGT